MKIIKITVLLLFAVSLGTSVSVSEAKQEIYVPNKHHAQWQTRSVLGPKTLLLQKDSLDGWTTTGGKTPGDAWSVIDGVLHLKSKGGDIMTDREYKNFVLDFTWTIAKGGNSGVKYRFKKFDGKGWLGIEYQVLDDFNIGEGKKLKNNTATLYDILPTSGSKVLQPHEEINHGRIIVNGNRIEHWLNGKKVVDVLVGSKAWKKGIAESKFNDVPGFGENALGRIMVQDHGSEVWFHDISIREIVKTTTKPKLFKKIKSRK
jgi:hypothetical protein